MATYNMLLLSLSPAIFHSYCYFFVLHPIEPIHEAATNISLSFKPAQPQIIVLGSTATKLKTASDNKAIEEPIPTNNFLRHYFNNAKKLSTI